MAKKKTQKKSTKKTAKKKTSVTATVVSVTDGDTFNIDKKVRGSKRVRIANTDAPEKGQKGSVKAKKNLEKKVLKKKVKLVPKGKSFGRLVADVSVDGKKVKASPEKTKAQKKSATRKKTSKKGKK